MKRTTRNGKVNGESKASNTAIKTISLPQEILTAAEAKIARDPEMNFSMYVRDLIRRDLAPTLKAA